MSINVSTSPDANRSMSVLKRHSSPSLMRYSSKSLLALFTSSFSYSLPSFMPITARNFFTSSARISPCLFSTTAAASRTRLPMKSMCTRSRTRASTAVICVTPSMSATRSRFASSMREPSSFVRGYIRSMLPANCVLKGRAVLIASL